MADAMKGAVELRAQLAALHAQAQTNTSQDLQNRIQNVHDQMVAQEQAADRWRRLQDEASSQIAAKQEAEDKKLEDRAKQVAQNIVSAQQSMLDRIKTKGAFSFDTRAMGEIVIGKTVSLESEMKKTAKNTAEVAKEMVKVRELMESGGLTFT